MLPPDSLALVGPPPIGLDQKCVLKNFLGKNQAQAKAMFRESSIVADDFAWMTEAGVRYYIIPALEYLESDESSRDWEFANFLLCSLYIQADRADASPEILAMIKRVADYLDANHAKFDIGTDEEEELFHRYLVGIRRQE